MGKKPVKDVFELWKLKGAYFAGKYEMPIVKGTSLVPEAIVPFSICEEERKPACKSVHFYEYDEEFCDILANRREFTKKLKTLRRFQSVILPDHSVYRDFPLAMQIGQVFKSRAAGNFLRQHGINIIPNVRWGDERTYEFAFDGIEKNATIAVGAQGGYRDKEASYYFEEGFVKMVDVLIPATILIYGSISSDLQRICEMRNIKTVSFPTEISKRRKRTKRTLPLEL